VLDPGLCGTWGLFERRIAEMIYGRVPPQGRQRQPASEEARLALATARREWAKAQEDARLLVRRLRQVEPNPKGADLDYASRALHGISVGYFLHREPPPDDEGGDQPLILPGDRSGTTWGKVRRTPTGGIVHIVKAFPFELWKQHVLSREVPVWPSRGQLAGQPTTAPGSSQP
jgi:hypothetical protein